MFDVRGFQIVRNVIPAEVAQHISDELSFLETWTSVKNGAIPERYDGLVDNAFATYSAFATEVLLEKLKPTVEKIVGKQLHPTYSYCRNYYRFAEMRSHKDRESCEYSMSINFSNDGEDWPLQLIDKEGTHHRVSMNPGDGLVYQGHLVEHWRDSYQGNKMAQGFLFWVDANGKHADQIYDGRPYLGFKPPNRDSN